MGIELFPTLPCPACGAQLELDGLPPSTQITCAHCGGEFILRGRLCLACGAYHPTQVESCARCGAGLHLRCVHCDTINWVGDVRCIACGAEADLIARMVKRHALNTADFLYQQMDAARDLKAAERAGSEQRMARLQEKEDARQEALRRQAAARKAEEQQMLRYLFIGVGGLMLLVLIGALITLL